MYKRQSPLPPFRSRPLNRCKLPQWGLVLSPSRQTIWCILESKNAALVAAVFVDFPMNKCNFMPKNKLDIVRRVQFLTGRRPVRSFSRGAVATIAQYGSRGSRRLHCHEKKCQVAPKRCQFVVQKMTPSKVPNDTPKFGCRYGTFSLAPRRHAMNTEASIPVRCRSTSQ